MTELSWSSALGPEQRASVGTLIAAATAADGVAPVGEQVVRDIRRDSEPTQEARHLVCLGDAGQIVGYLNLTAASGDDDGMAELVVHPDARRRGIGTALLRAAAERAGHKVRFWAHGTTPSAQAVAAKLEMTAERQLLQMSRPLAGLPEFEAAEDIRIRSYAGATDDAELLRVNNAAFSWHPEQGGWTAADIAQRREESWFDPDGLFLAVDAASGELLGFHWTKVHSEHQGLGEVYVVGIDPGAQGRGLGRTLTLIGLHYLAGKLADYPEPTVMLYVESDNAAAVRTYDKLGFTVASVDTAYAIPVH